MTVAALLRGETGTYNALVVDSGVGAYGAGVTYECEHDKLRLAFGNTYITVVGDALLLEAVLGVISWLDPQRPNLREPAAFSSILTGLERLRAIRRMNKVPIAANPGGAHLLVCSREDAFYWTSNYDASAGSFSRPATPADVRHGECVVVWGLNTFVPVHPFPVTPAEPFGPIIDVMQQVDAKVQALGYKLPYTLTRRCSGVMLPHRTSDQLRRARPFDSLPEQWVKYGGGQAMSLLDDPEFMQLTLPKTT